MQRSSPPGRALLYIFPSISPFAAVKFCSLPCRILHSPLEILSECGYNATIKFWMSGGLSAVHRGGNEMKKYLAILLALCLALSLCACGGSKSDAPAAQAPAASIAGNLGAKDGGAELTFTTGGPAGTYYAFGGVIAQKVSEVTSTKVTAITSGGSKANIEALEMGDAQLAFSQSDVLSYAYAGTRSFSDTGAVTNFSIVAPLYMEQVQIVTLNPEIKTVADLGGRAVSIGAAGSGVYFNAIDILGAYDLTEADIKPTYQSFGDSADALKNGQIDAAFIVAGAPTTAVTDLATTKAVHLVSLDDEHVAKLLASSPYYTACTISADTYGTDGDVTTVGVGAVLLARNDVSEDAVYALVADIFDNAANLTSSHAKYGEVSLDYGASITSVPYHPGAARYFAEKGLTVAD